MINIILDIKEFHLDQFLSLWKDEFLETNRISKTT